MLNNMKSTIQEIRSELEINVDEKTKQSYQRFFKKPVKYYGVKTGIVRKIAEKYWQAVKKLNKKEIFSLCEMLYASDYCEETFIVSFWIPNLTDQFEPTDILTFERWIKKYINNWAKCDSFCNHSVGNFIEKYPELIKELKRWSKSNNCWLKRAAAVSLIIPAKKGKFLENILEITNKLLLDENDMVQKGYGWLLKEASRRHQQEIFEYVVKNRKRMPRTALRYAVELMPKTLKYEAMRHD